MEIKLGDTARDTITGFMGVCTARAVYITGCNQVFVQPKLDKDGKFVDGHWVDEDRLEAIAGPSVSLKVTNPGCDTPAPPGR